MILLPYISDPRQAATATELIATLGSDAAAAAERRAARSRDVGNHIQFCRWRQIGRLIDLLQQEGGAGSLH